MSETHAYNEWLDACRKLAVVQARIARDKARPMDCVTEERLCRRRRELEASTKVNGSSLRGRGHGVDVISKKNSA